MVSHIKNRAMIKQGISFHQIIPTPECVLRKIALNVQGHLVLSRVNGLANQTSVFNISSCFHLQDRDTQIHV
jgi:hypothetical protein